MKKLANRSIRYGFKIHRVGKRTRQAGVGVSTVGAGALGVVASTNYLSTLGRTTGLPFKMTHLAGRLIGMTKISRIPAYHWAIEKLGKPAQEFGRRKALRASGWFMQGPRPMRAAGKFIDFAARHKVVPRSMKAVAIGAGIAAAGYGVERAGNALIKHGFKAHPSYMKQRVRRFFGLRGKPRR